MLLHKVVGCSIFFVGGGGGAWGRSSTQWSNDNLVTLLWMCIMYIDNSLECGVGVVVCGGGGAWMEEEGLSDYSIVHSYR